MAELGDHQSALLTDLALCINRYRLFSPGWYVCVMAKVQLSAEEWEVPGLVAMVNYGLRLAQGLLTSPLRGPQVSPNRRRPAVVRVRGQETRAQRVLPT
jgi:hypothetical protein